MCLTILVSLRPLKTSPLCVHVFRERSLRERGNVWGHYVCAGRCGCGRERVCEHCIEADMVCVAALYLWREESICVSSVFRERVCGGGHYAYAEKWLVRENVDTLFLGTERVCVGTLFMEREGVWALYL